MRRRRLVKSRDQKNTGNCGVSASCRVSMSGWGIFEETVRQFRAPIGAGAAFLLVPGHRLPVRRENQEAAAIDLDPIAAGFVEYSEKPCELLCFAGPTSMNMPFSLKMSAARSTSSRSSTHRRNDAAGASCLSCPPRKPAGDGQRRRLARNRSRSRRRRTAPVRATKDPAAPARTTVRRRLPWPAAPGGRYAARRRRVPDIGTAGSSTPSAARPARALLHEINFHPMAFRVVEAKGLAATEIAVAPAQAQSGSLQRRDPARQRLRTGGPPGHRADPCRRCSGQLQRCRRVVAIAAQPSGPASRGRPPCRARRERTRRCCRAWATAVRPQPRCAMS